jgi:hypothetical protein
MLYALLSENHGWIHGYSEDDTVEYGSDIRLYHREFKDMDSLAKKLSLITGEKIYLKSVELKFCKNYEPKLTFRDILRGDKFYCEDWLYSKISDTQAVCIVSDSGVVNLCSGDIYTFPPNNIVKKYE